jgi:hypothetical protein
MMLLMLSFLDRLFLNLLLYGSLRVQRFASGKFQGRVVRRRKELLVVEGDFVHSYSKDKNFRRRARQPQSFIIETFLERTHEEITTNENLSRARCSVK